MVFFELFFVCCRVGELMVYIFGECEFWLLLLKVFFLIFILCLDMECLVELVLDKVVLIDGELLDFGIGIGVIVLVLVLELFMW